MAGTFNPNTILESSNGTELGTASNPIRQDPTGTTTQPINSAQLPAALGAQGGLVIEGVANGTPVPISGTVNTAVVRPANSTTAQTSVNNTSITLLASNANRLGAILYNPGNTTVFVKLGTAVTTTDYSFPMTKGQSVELGQPVYTGAITGTVASGTQSINTTELTA